MLISSNVVAYGAGECLHSCGPHFVVVFQLSTWFSQNTSVRRSSGLIIFTQG